MKVNTSMSCEDRIVIGKKWNMRYRYTDYILVRCKYQKKYKVTYSLPKGISRTDLVCGTHKNVILRKYPNAKVEKCV